MKNKIIEKYNKSLNYLKQNKKKIIFLLIILYILIFKIVNVNAMQIGSSGIPSPSISMGFKNYIEESNTLFFSDSIDYLNINKRVDDNFYYGGKYLFDLPSNSIMTNVFIDYSYNSVTMYNETSTNQYLYLGNFNDWLSRSIIPTSSTCPFYNAYQDYFNVEYNPLYSSYMSFKNFNVLSCTYEDISNHTHTCGDDLSYIQPSGSNTNFLITRNNNTYFEEQGAGSYTPTTKEQNTYYKNNWYYPNQNKYLAIKIAPQTQIKNLKITLGGVGNYSGSLQNLNSYGNTSSVNLYYNNYELIRGCTFGSETLTFQSNGVNDNLQVTSGGSITQTQYDNLFNNNKVEELSQSAMEQLISQQTASGEIAKDFALQQTLIGDDPVAQEEELDGVLAAIREGLGGSIVGQTATIFQDIFSTPIELLDELADHDTCESYTSSIYGYTVSNNFTITLPFTHDIFSLNCSDVNFIGRTPPEANANFQFNIVYHGFITGILCYYCVLTYLVFIKSLFNLKDNNVEVLEI